MIIQVYVLEIIGITNEKVPQAILILGLTQLRNKLIGLRFYVLR